MRVIRPENLYLFCRPYAVFSPTREVSMDEKDSNHDVLRHKKDVHIAVEIHYT
jgi:hypothetical protein